MNLLRAEDIVKNYASHRALDGVSLSIPQGKIFGLLGPNGAGKTSLIRIMTQITGADEGEIYFKENRMTPQDAYRIGYLPEERGLYKKMKVGEQLVYLARLKGLSQSEAIHRLKAWFVKLEIEKWWDKKVDDLSKGMQQKVQFIATVVHQPDLIILDEPFSGFDPINANLIKDEILALKAAGATIILSTHRMESVEELCDNIALINRSKVVLAGAVRDIKRQYRTHQYVIDYTGPLASLPAPLQADRQITLEEDTHRVWVQLAADTPPNMLLSALISQVQVHRFEELVPSMNDIFIQTVTANGEAMPVLA
jgi:ABC-2 type transport system ATP-binding protein